MTLLAVSELRVRFPPRNGEPAAVPVDGVSFTLAAGEVLALVGESGCGKSLTSLALARLIPPPGEIAAGSGIRLADADVLALGPAALRQLRGGQLGMVFQDPAASLDPVYPVGAQVIEAIRAHRPAGRGEARDRAAGLFREVGLSEEYLDSYPHHLSGGQRQRVMLAIALAADPVLLVADEPTSALDVTVQAQILELLEALRARRGLAVLLVTHDLGIAAGRADRVAVMYAGQIVESGPARQVFGAPAHPYTRALLESMPRLHDGPQRTRPIPGTVPQPSAWPAGCRFHPRCPHAWERCRSEAPTVFTPGAGRTSRCWLSEEASG